MIVSVEEAVEQYRKGKFVIIVDDESRENEGDLAIAAEFATPEAINFMATHGRGLICIAMTNADLDRLNVPYMVEPSANASGFGTPFTISVEAKHGVTTGISAYDRAKTIQTLIDPQSTPNDIAKPGHMFPLRAHDKGVLARRGQTEASVDLARLAGLHPSGVICEIISPDGTMARLPELITFSKTFGIPIVSVDALANYRAARPDQNETAATTTDNLSTTADTPHLPYVTNIATTHLPTEYGTFCATVYRDVAGLEHLLLSMGDLAELPSPLVRIHSECLTGDAFGSLRCDCGEQLQLALRHIAQEGRGAVVYMRQEGRGIGLANKIKAYALQDEGLDTVEANEHLGLPADARSYVVASSILQKEGVTAVRLMTNNPDKVQDLHTHGITVTERIAHVTPVRDENRRYLTSKAQKMGHYLSGLTP